MMDVHHDEIVIIGYALRLPESDNPLEFHENLLNKNNLVSKIDSPNLSAYIGKLKHPIDYFDNLFFGIHGKQAEKTDPQLRIILEGSFEALIDAGLMPDDIKGTNTGVYAGVCFSDAHQLWMENLQTMTGYEHSGCAGTMFPNRLSYFYDLHGPSITVDTACSSSMTALHYAVKDLEQNKCDTAFVFGSSILLRDAITLGFQKLQMLSPDGFCKTFDKLANGYSRAEGVISLLLTKRKDLIRYTPRAKVLASSCNTVGYHPQGISYPNHLYQAQLYEEVLQKSHTSPDQIHYIECHGTGTVAGDSEELLGITKYFGDRSDLTLGALKSNIGHTEGASGLAGIAKVLLSYETQTLYPQLHLQEKNPLLGNLQTVTEAQFEQKIGKVLINSFGFGGANACVLIDNISPQAQEINHNWHNLFFISSRTKEGVYALKREVEKNPIQLPHFNDKRYPWREVIGLDDDLQLAAVESRPLYFAFSGNGSQWRGMGLALMEASVLFKETLSKCGKDIPDLLKQGWQGPLQDTRLLTAIQIGLLELLKESGIKADGYIAHSAGEIAASYASGATSIEETMAIAEARGRAAEEMPEGLMMSVGLSQEEALSYISEFNEVSLACINSPRNVTLSGNKQQIETIEKRLLAEEKFVRILNSQGRPYHSCLIDKNNVEKHLLKAITKTTPKNKQWIPAITDYEPDEFSADYHIQSVTRPVDFLSAVQKIPENAIVLEIGPHRILRAIIRDCLPSLHYVSLMEKETSDLQTFKEGLGHLWKLGVNISFIPDKVRPNLAIRSKQTAWAREYLPIPRQEKPVKQSFVFDLEGKDSYLMGHVVNGRAIFPAMGMVWALWQSYLAYHPDCKVVTVDNFKIFKGIPLVGEKLILHVLISPNGEYQLLWNDECVAKALISHKTQDVSPMAIPAFETKDSLSQTNFYRLCHNKGYQYTNDFQVIEEAYIPDDPGFIFAKASSKHEISFLDGLLHLILLREVSMDMMLPTGIRHIRLSQNKSEEVIYNSYTKTLQCGEILIQGGEYMPITKVNKEEKGIQFLEENHLFLGHTPHSQEKADYAQAVFEYAVLQFKKVQDKLTEPHHLKIKEILANYNFEKAEVDKLSNYDKAYFYQLIKDAYTEFDSFISSPLSYISTRPYYSNLYHDDFGYDFSFLNKIMSTIRQNTSYKINVFELGTGTGGFLKQASNCLYPLDNIICTDIGGNRLQYNDNIKHLNINFFEFDINKEFTTEIQNKIRHADLVVAHNSFHVSNDLKHNLQRFYQLMKPGAFFLLYELTSPLLLLLFGMDSSTWHFKDERQFGLWTSVDHWKSLFKDTDFSLIAYQTDPLENNSLFLVRKPLTSEYTCLPKPSILFDTEWASAIKESIETPIIYSEEPEGIAGFARSLTMEGKHILSLCAPSIDPWLDQVKSNGLVTNLVRENRLATLCYTSSTAVNTLTEIKDKVYHLEFAESGNLESYHFALSKEYPGQLCKVAFSALNFRDVMLASGKISKSSFLGFSKHSSGVGMEFSGFCGDKRIMGIAPDAIANYVYTDFFWEIPDNLDLADAATMPVAYLTVYYAFFERAHLRKNHKILIHGGAGAVGQAAIRVALDIGCEIFTTCQQAKRDYLKTLFPQLDDAHIGDSRSSQFEQQVMIQTKGKGVDIILNSLADEKLQASLNCLAQHGTFIEIGKYDLMKNTPIGLKHFLPNTTFCGIDLDQIFSNVPVMKRISTRLLKGIEKGVVQPIDKTIFQSTEIVEAFRYLGSGNHKGKVVFDLQKLDPEVVENRFYTSGAHLIVGGLGGLGMAITDWLAERGAKQLILVSRRGITTGEQKLFVQKLRAKYPFIKISIKKADLTHPVKAEKFLKTCPPLTGIYNLAMVLNDVLFDKMTAEQWNETVHTKVLTTFNLDQFTQDHPIQQFVCFSSISAQGNAAQANYAYANNYMESICYDRQAQGKPAKAIQWGPLGNVGFVANINIAGIVDIITNNLGAQLLSIQSTLKYFEYCLLSNSVVNTVWQHIIPDNNVAKEDGDILAKISRIIGVDLMSIPDDTALVALGLDSLQAAEILSVISYSSNQNISVSEFGKITIGELKEKFIVTEVEHASANSSDSSAAIPQEFMEKIKQHGEELILDTVSELEE